MWPIYVEYFFSVLWAYSMLAIVILFFLGLFMPIPAALYVPTLIPGWTGVLIALTCLLQVAVGMGIDRRYDKIFLKNYLLIIWYPIAYWTLSWLTSIAAVPKTIFRKKGKRARWVSPDRGIR